MILDSMFCLSSLMLQRIMPDRVDPSIPIKYYQQCIKSIRSYLTIPGIETNEKGIISRCLLSTILLCIYELFFVAIDSTYVKGASSILASILSKHNVQGKSLLKDSPFHQTCFWAVFLCDLILSLKFDLPTMYSLETFWKPLDPEYFELFNKYGTQFLSNNVRDREIFISNSMLNKEHTMWWLHKAVINYSCINEFKNLVTVISREDCEANKPFHDWLRLKQLMDEFESNMPINLKPNIYKPASATRVFPLIYFKDEVTAITGLNFKLSKIALYESLLLRTDTRNELVQLQLEQYPRGYAKKLTKDIIGIMKTYDSNLYLWPVNVHTLRQVAHYVFDEPEAHRILEELVERIISVCNLRLQDKIVRR
ncbi:uncharacterized protein CANTADRAFT_91354 [Suhomyces tanzawaensis NRRL Y-17324]|uniref:Uncharacterized protein n=1 Tax=Suhomyces tanzawaensis NRRL Y-17324 TaxID=984487 RepID=A0A1E4SEF6_9ASCO|nr:uncharacterized protein CANTADRAFT_91354 [Suhomyces tanzawaensis NRRL Y-17324]ODV77904.1 hypothetical protein CANTADRAFT_91354 [Suhomyces tanzawaensis NRRL Y-17324]